MICFLNLQQLNAPNAEIKDKKFTLWIVLLIILIISMFLLVACIFLVVGYFINTGLIAAYLDSNPKLNLNQTPISLHDGLRSMLKHTSKFVTIGLVTSNHLILKYADEFIKEALVSLS